MPLRRPTALQERNKGDIPRISHRHTDITEQTAALGALDSRALETLFELLTCHAGEIFQARVYLGRMRLRVWACSVVSFAIPGTDVLANITPKDVVASWRTEIRRNSAFELDRQIRDTTLRIQGVGLQNRLRRTSLQAAGTCPAMVERRTVVFQRDGRMSSPSSTQETEPSIQQAGIFTNPAEPGNFA